MYHNNKIKKINNIIYLTMQQKKINSIVQRFNYLPFLLHNFTGFLTLDIIIKNIHKGSLSKHKLFVFSGNVVKFEYRYKFDEVNLRALKPKQNELFIYVDFGLKRILQFNSKQFYLNKESVIATSDRVNALFYKLDIQFEDELLWSCSFNQKNLKILTKKAGIGNLLSSPIFNLNSLKFFVDDFIFKNCLFSYTGFVEQLMNHAFYIQFFNFNLFNFYFSSFVYGLNTNFIFKSFESVFDNFLKILYVDRVSLPVNGFLWYQQRVNGFSSFKHTFYIKTTPILWRRKLYKFYYNEQFNLKKRGAVFSKVYKGFFSKSFNFNYKCASKKKIKRKSLLFFILNLCKKKTYYVKSLNKFKLNVLKRFFFKTNILYLLKFKIKSNYIFKLKKILRVLSKKFRQYTYNLAVSSGLNKDNKIQTSFFINNLFYIDYGFLVSRKKNKSTRFFSNRILFVKKKVFILKKTLRKTIIKKIADKKFKKNIFLKVKIKLKKKKKSKVKSVNFIKKKKFSKRVFIKSITKLLSVKQQFYFKNWLEYRFNNNIANFFGAIPFAFFYKGFAKNRMYLFYKKNFAVLCNQLEFLNLVLRYFWLTTYLKRLVINNITKLQIFKIKKDSLNSFNLKLSFNDYLIKLIKAFGYDVIIKMQNFNFMTSQVSKIIAPPSQKKMKFFWRTIKTDFVPYIVDNFTKLYAGNLIFLRFSLLFVMFHNFFLYHKRFDFKIGVGFWKRFLRLKENFSLLFLKETPISFVLSKDYYVYFYNLINKHKFLFFRLLFYLKKNLQNKSIHLLSLKNLALNSFLFQLNSILFFKKNIFKFSIFFFFNFFYTLKLKYNIFFSPTNSYLNYKNVYDKLFLNINQTLKFKILHKKRTFFSSNLKQFFLNIKSLKHVINYTFLLSISCLSIKYNFKFASITRSDNLFKANRITFCKKNNAIIGLNLVEKTLFLFNLKLKQNKITSLSESFYSIKMQKKQKSFLLASHLINNNKCVRYYSTNVTFIKKVTSSKSFFQFFLLRKKNLFLKKKFKKRKRYYSIFFFFNKYKKIKFYYFYCFFRKSNSLNKIYLNKKRLNYLFKYSNLFNNFHFLTQLFKHLVLKFKIKNTYKNFLIKYFLTCFFKNALFFNLKNFRMIFVSFVYTLIFSLKKKVFSNLYFFIKNVSYSYKKLFTNNSLQTQRTFKYLIFFANKINFMFFNNIRSHSELYFKQLFYLFNKFKNTLNLTKFNVIASNRVNITYQKNNFVYDLFSFRTKVLTKYNDVFFYLNSLGFFYLTKLSVINLFFFNNKKYNNLNFTLTKTIKNFFTSCSLLKFHSELKRLRFFMHVLNLFLDDFFLKNLKKKFNVKNIFWLFNLTTFHLTLKFNRFKKKVLLKYNYPFFFKTKKKNVGAFNRRFFFKKQYKLFKFIYNYGGSRFYKLKSKRNRRIQRKLTKISNKKFSRFLKWLKSTSKKKRTNLLAKNKQFRNQYYNYFFFKNSLKTAFKIKLFSRSLRKLGFKVNTFFIWSIPKKKWNWRNSHFKNSLKRVLWSKGRAYYLNKLNVIKHILYSYANPFKIRYSFRKIKMSDDKWKWFGLASHFINPTKHYIIKTYNISHYFGKFFKYARTLCLTRRKKKRILKKLIFLKFIVFHFRNVWSHRLWYAIKARNVLARGDGVFFLKQHNRKVRSKRFYFMSKFLFLLTKTKGVKFLVEPFVKSTKYDKYIVRLHPFGKKALLAKEKREKVLKEITREKATYSRLLRRIFRKRLKRRYFIFKKKHKKISVRYSKFFLKKSMRNFWASRHKKIKPPFRTYYNLMPWHKDMASEKILNFHNQLFSKYRKTVELANKHLYLSDPVLFKQFRNMKNSKFFKLSEKQKLKFEKFKKAKREKKLRKK